MQSLPESTTLLCYMQCGELPAAWIKPFESPCNLQNFAKGAYSTMTNVRCCMCSTRPNLHTSHVRVQFEQMNVAHCLSRTSLTMACTWKLRTVIVVHGRQDEHVKATIGDAPGTAATSAARGYPTSKHKYPNVPTVPQSA